MATQSPGKERKGAHPKSLLSLGIPWLSPLPVTALGIMGSKGTKVLFAISAEISWQGHRGAWASHIQNPSPWTIRKFGIPFLLEMKLHRSSLAAGWGFSFFLILLNSSPFFKCREGEPGKPTKKKNPSSLSSLSRQVCEQHLGHQSWVYFHMVSKV